MSMAMTRRDLLRHGAGGAVLLGASAMATPYRAVTGAQATELSAIWWDWDPWNAAATEIFDAYQQATGVAVRLRLTPYDDLDRSVRSTPQVPNPPDLMMVDGPSVRTYVANGLLLPVDDAFPAAVREDFFPTPRIDGTWDGHFYGPAMDESSQGIFFNRAILARHGIAPPETLDDAWTWPEAREAFIEVQAKEREARGADQFWALNFGAFGGPLGGGVWHGGMTVRSNGEEGSPTYLGVSEDGLTTDGYINTPEAVEALQFLQDLYQNDVVVPATSATDLFPNELVAFWLSNMSNRYYIAEANPELEWGVMPMPYHKTPIVHTGSFHVVVSAFAPNPEAAVEALTYLAGPENGAIMAREARDLPLRRSALAEFPEYIEGPLRIFAETTEHWGRPRPLTPGFADYDTVYTPALNDIAGGAPVKETIDQAAADIDRQLERYRLLAAG